MVNTVQYIPEAKGEQVCSEVVPDGNSSGTVRNSSFVFCGIYRHVAKPVGIVTGGQRGDCWRFMEGVL